MEIKVRSEKTLILWFIYPKGIFFAQQISVREKQTSSDYVTTVNGDHIQQ